MPIDSKKIDALLDTIRKTLNPPVPVEMTMEDFLKYAGEQLSKLASEEGEIAKSRVLSLETAFAAMKAAGEAKLEKADVITFTEPAPLTATAGIPVDMAPAIPAAPVVAEATAVAPAMIAPEPAPITEPEIAKAAKFVWPADMNDSKPSKPADKK